MCVCVCVCERARSRLGADVPCRGGAGRGLGRGAGQGVRPAVGLAGRWRAAAVEAGASSGLGTETREPVRASCWGSEAHRLVIAAPGEGWEGAGAGSVEPSGGGRRAYPICCYCRYSLQHLPAPSVPQQRQLLQPPPGLHAQLLGAHVSDAAGDLPAHAAAGAAAAPTRPEPRPGRCTRQAAGCCCWRQAVDSGGAPVVGVRPGAAAGAPHARRPRPLPCPCTW